MRLRAFDRVDLKKINYQSTSCTLLCDRIGHDILGKFKAFSAIFAWNNSRWWQYSQILNSVLCNEYVAWCCGPAFDRWAFTFNPNQSVWKTQPFKPFIRSLQWCSMDIQARWFVDENGILFLGSEEHWTVAGFFARLILWRWAWPFHCTMLKVPEFIGVPPLQNHYLAIFFCF